MGTVVGGDVIQVGWGSKLLNEINLVKYEDLS